MVLSKAFGSGDSSAKQKGCLGHREGLGLGRARGALQAAGGGAGAGRAWPQPHGGQTVLSCLLGEGVSPSCF